jgi:hypothetical protein
VTVREDILKLVRDFPEGIGVPFIRETLRITNGTARYWLEKLVEEGLVRKEEEFVFRRPYYWFYTYYPVPVEVPLPPPPPPVVPPVPPIPEYIHITLVYNVKTEDDAGRKIDISITFDFDCKNEEEMKDVLKRFCFLKAHTWLDAKFGDRIPIAAEWAETEEKASDSEVVTELVREEENFTILHYKWNYWREVGDKTEEAEGDLEDWEEEIPTGATWVEARKGRKPKVG